VAAKTAGASSSIKCQWQLHVPAAPTIGDHLITVTNRRPDLKWADPSLQPRGSEGRLFCQTLAPRRYKVISYGGGQTRTLRADGRSDAPVPGNPYHLKYGGHVIQIDPGDSAHGMVFLHVLTAADADHTAAPAATYRHVRRGQIEVRVNGATTLLSVPDWFGE